MPDSPSLASLISLVTLPVFSRALIALAAAGAAFPALGTFILNLELIPARFAVMHAALLGAALALLIHADPLFVSMAAAALTGIGVALASWKGKVSAGGSLGLVMTLSLGLAFIIFYKGNIHAIEAFNLFWGNILALQPQDVKLIVIACALILIFLALAWKEIKIVLYDRELASLSGVPAKIIYTAIILTICLGIALAMRVTGALLVDAVTLLPALAARHSAKTLAGLIIRGSIFGLLMNLGGFTLSLLLDLPVSPSIIVCGAAVILLTKCFSRKKS